MREILFRGKTVGVNKWIYGQWLPKSKKIFYETEYNGKVDFVGFYVDEKTAGQYTGLTDKNGTKIFEGDIVESICYFKQTDGVVEKKIRGSIEYGAGWAYSEVYGVCERFRDGSGVALLSLMQGTKVADCKVIGNIHDNPELVKGE